MNQASSISWLRKINVCLLMAAIIFLPYWIFIVTRILTFYIASSLILGLYERKKPAWNLQFFLLLALYVFYVLGIFWSENTDRALFDFEVKMSLAIFPVNFLFIQYSKKEIKGFF